MTLASVFDIQSCQELSHCDTYEGSVHGGGVTLAVISTSVPVVITAGADEKDIVLVVMLVDAVTKVVVGKLPLPAVTVLVASKVRVSGSIESRVTDSVVRVVVKLVKLTGGKQLLFQ